MRNWLRDERSKLSEVIQRHARMQNVGAMIGDPNDDDHDPSSSFKDTKLRKGKRYASYDLTKARTQELGSITRVEEFGLSSITKETTTNDVHRDDNNDSSNVKRHSNSNSCLPNSDDDRNFIDADDDDDDDDDNDHPSNDSADDDNDDDNNDDDNNYDKRQRQQRQLQRPKRRRTFGVGRSTNVRTISQQSRRSSREPHSITG